MTPGIDFGARGSCDCAQDDNHGVILRAVAGSTPADAAAAI